MKKIISKVAIITLAMLMCVTMVGCELFKFGKGSKANLPDSTAMLNNVVFNTQQTERVLMDKVAAVNKVKRSAVAITMTTSSTVSAGSGVIVDINKVDDKGNVIDGQNVFYVVTCHHVVAGMGTIHVYVPDAEGDNYGESDYDEKFI